LVRVQDEFLEDPGLNAITLEQLQILPAGSALEDCQGASVTHGAHISDSSAQPIPRLGRV
jgi:hypothetical protein